jgi:hypothetical protein
VVFFYFSLTLVSTMLHTLSYCCGIDSNECLLQGEIIMTARMINFVTWLNSNPNNVRIVTIAVSLALTIAAGAGIETIGAMGSAPGGTDAN